MGFLIADGFAITTKLYDEFINYNDLTEIIKNKLTNISIDDITVLDVISCELRQKIFEANFTQEHEQLIINTIMSQHFGLLKGTAHKLLLPLVASYKDAALVRIQGYAGND